MFKAFLMEFLFSKVCSYRKCAKTFSFFKTGTHLPSDIFKFKLQVLREVVFLAHPSVHRHPPSVRPSIRLSSTAFKDFLLQNRWANQRPNFIWSLSGLGERKFVCGVWVTWPRWQSRPYMVKTLQKSSSPEPKGQWPCGLVCSIGALGPS